MQSALYRGWVRHRRVAPTRNSFRYRLFMVWLDLAELDRVFAGRWFWSTTRRTLARFVREDYLAPHDRPLDEASGGHRATTTLPRVAVLAVLHDGVGMPLGRDEGGNRHRLHLAAPHPRE